MNKVRMRTLGENKGSSHVCDLQVSTITVKAKQTGHKWLMGNTPQERTNNLSKTTLQSANSSTLQTALTSDTHTAILLNADFYIHCFQNGYLNGNKLGVRWNRVGPTPTGQEWRWNWRMQMRENVEGQMRVDMIDKEERGGGGSVSTHGWPLLGA